MSRLPLLAQKAAAIARKETCVSPFDGFDGAEANMSVIQYGIERQISGLPHLVLASSKSDGTKWSVIKSLERERRVFAG
jgi:hypothetical protein